MSQPMPIPGKEEVVKSLCQRCGYPLKRSPGPSGQLYCATWGCPDVSPALAEGERPDLVNHPPHYTTGKIEVLDFIEDQKFGYLDGQVIKYVARHKHKGAALQDLKKAQFYLSRLIKNVEEEK